MQALIDGERDLKVTYYAASSVDGYIAKSDGDVSWLEELDISMEDSGYESFFSTVDGLVMGRKTYEIIKSFGAWPYGDKPTWVCTCGEVEPSEGANLQNEKLPEAVVEAARDQGIKHLWLVGGGSLAASFVEKSLLTHTPISLMPIILGGGIPLFGPMGDHTHLKLKQCQSHAAGFMQIECELKERGK